MIDLTNILPGWNITGLIGEGSFGKVYEIERNNFGIEEHCALKVISIPSSQAELQSLKNEGMDEPSIAEYYRGLVDEFVQEIALMSKLKGNKNIVGYEDYAVIEHKDSIGWDIVIRMELLTDLPTHIRNNSISEGDVITLAIDICSALEVCHRHRVIHRDIKPDNIFVSKNGEYKLGDFGVARTIEKTVSGLSKKGTYTYMAPEVYRGDPYGTNVDLYSLGIVMYKLMNNNREPFLPPHPQVIRYNDKTSALSRRLSGESIPAPANASEFLGSIILKACSYQKPGRYHVASHMKADLITAKNSLNSNPNPVLQANHLIASQTSKTNQDEIQSSSYNTYNNSTSSNSVNKHAQFNGYSSMQNDAEVYAHTDKKEKNSRFKKAAFIIGWTGAVLWLAATLLIKDIFFIILSAVVVLLMILLSNKKLSSIKVLFGVMMLILSACTFNVLNFISSIIFLRTKEQA